MAMTRREFLGSSLAVGTMSLVSHLDSARRLRGGASESDVLAFTHVALNGTLLMRADLDNLLAHVATRAAASNAGRQIS